MTREKCWRWMGGETIGIRFNAPCFIRWRFPSKGLLGEILRRSLYFLFLLGSWYFLTLLEVSVFYLKIISFFLSLLEGSVEMVPLSTLSWRFFQEISDLNLYYTLFYAEFSLKLRSLRISLNLILILISFNLSLNWKVSESANIHHNHRASNPMVGDHIWPRTRGEKDPWITP